MTSPSAEPLSERKQQPPKANRPDAFDGWRTAATHVSAWFRFFAICTQTVNTRPPNCPNANASTDQTAVEDRFCYDGHRRSNPTNPQNDGLKIRCSGRLWCLLAIGSV